MQGMIFKIGIFSALNDRLMDGQTIIGFIQI
jgi:hypothetical protein